MKTYDIIVIGTGAGNIVLEQALKKGLKCAQIEKGKFGGTCLTRGCIPTKVLVGAADRLYEIKESAQLGITCSNVNFNWQTISNRVWHKINQSRDLRKIYLETANLDVYEGTGFFIENHIIAVNNNDGTVSEPLTAAKIYINTGGETKIPLIAGLSDVDYVTSESFFGHLWPDQPYENVTILGGGAIGCEFAHIFKAFGAKVNLIQHNVRLLPKEDPQLSASLLHNLRQDGINCYLNKDTPSVRQIKNDIYLTIQDRETGDCEEIISQTLFICPGIVPNSKELNLENTDIQCDKRGWIRTNEFLETSVDGVYALGDINGLQQFRHKANYEADILAHNHFVALSPEEFRWANYDLVPAVTFSHFEVAHIGLTEEQALQHNRSIKVAINPYSATAKGYALGFENNNNYHAYAKLIIDESSQEILGMHAIGPFASTLIQPFLNLMSAGTLPFKSINDDIFSETTLKLRKNTTTRFLNPHLESTVRQTMVPHPSLSEVGIWTYYALEE